jgi:hypothetical protein
MGDNRCFLPCNGSSIAQWVGFMGDNRYLLLRSGSSTAHRIACLWETTAVSFTRFKSCVFLISYKMFSLLKCTIQEEEE